jgi:hypothetical protein
MDCHMPDAPPIDGHLKMTVCDAESWDGRGCQSLKQPHLSHWENGSGSVQWSDKRMGMPKEEHQLALLGHRTFTGNRILL